MKKLICLILLFFLLSNTAIATISSPHVNEKILNEESEELQTPTIPYADIYVDFSNTQGPWDGTYENPFQHIQDAIDSAENNDLIYVFKGNYYESLSIDKPIFLKGEKKSDTFILGSISIEGTNNVIIKHFTIGNLQNPPEEYLVRIYDSSNISIKQNIFSNFTLNSIFKNIFVISIYYSSFVKIFENSICNIRSRSRSYGIYVTNVFKSKFSYNNIQNLSGSHSKGIYLKNTVKDSIVSFNTIIDIKGNWADGIYIGDDSNENIITENIINKINGGFSDGIEVDDCSNNIISKNKISEVGFLKGNSAGIELIGTVYYSTISENIIYNITGDGPTKGIALSSKCNDNIIRKNSINNIISISKSVGITINLLSNITISENEIKNIIMDDLFGRGSIAIELWEVANFTISENLIDNHQTGICIINCNQGMVYKNTIDNTILGVGIDDFNLHGRPIFILNTNFTTFTKNLFLQLKSPRDVFFIFQHVIEENEEYKGGIPDSYDSSERHLSNIWDNNYWYRPRILPKKISGDIYVYKSLVIIKVPINNYDNNPLFSYTV